MGVAAAARLGRRPVARPAAAGLGGDPRRDHRGVGARAAAPGAPRRARGALRLVPAPAPTAVRAVVQSGLRPANCRLIDALEARADRRRRRSARGARARLRVHRPAGRRRRSRARWSCAARTAAQPDEPGGRRGRRRLARGLPAHALPARHARAPRASCRTPSRPRSPGSACRAFHEAVVGATREALGEPCRVTCRFTHVYPDGPAPYFTVLAPARRGDEVAQWHEMKRAASDAVLAAGGTITHHHAVGPRPPPVVRRPAPRAVRRRAAGGQGAPSTPRPSSTPGYSLDSHERRGQELRGDHQGEGRAQRQVPLPAAHRAHEPVRDRADASGRRAT